ncbi:MAG: hypothetical protein K0R73_1180 [Candidatus Midichloriaceae bacterium]|jgi:hypothetical protein|nr:hypothetical protein [Candidatus Midichloriaceae bacterium]
MGNSKEDNDTAIPSNDITPTPRDSATLVTDTAETNDDALNAQATKPRKPTPRYDSDPEAEKEDSNAQSAEASPEFKGNIDTLLGEGAGEKPTPAPANDDFIKAEETPPEKEGKHAAKVKENRRFCGTGCSIF